MRKRVTYNITKYDRLLSKIIQDTPIKYGNEKHNIDTSLFKFKVENSYKTKKINKFFPNKNINILHERNHQK